MTAPPPKRSPLMGMNMELRRAGVALHVQTEDLGLRRGELVTQVFVKGSIIETLRTQYHDPDALPSRPPPSEGALRHQMRDQHLSVVRAVQSGRYDQLTAPKEALTPSAPVTATSPISAPPQAPDIQREPTSTAPHFNARPEASATIAEQERREAHMILRGSELLTREELLLELSFTSQRPYPDPSAQLSALRRSLQEALDTGGSDQGS